MTLSARRIARVVFALNPCPLMLSHPLGCHTVWWMLCSLPSASPWTLTGAPLIQPLHSLRSPHLGTSSHSNRKYAHVYLLLFVTRCILCVFLRSPEVLERFGSSGVLHPIAHALCGHWTWMERVLAVRLLDKLCACAAVVKSLLLIPNTLRSLCSLARDLPDIIAQSFLVKPGRLPRHAVYSLERLLRHCLGSSALAVPWSTDSTRRSLFNFDLADAINDMRLSAMRALANVVQLCPLNALAHVRTILVLVVCRAPI